MKVVGVTFQVRVPDFEKGLSWYARFLNRPPDFVPHGGFAEWKIVPHAWLQVGEGKPEIARPIRFEVKDIYAEIKRLRDMGIKVSTVTRVEGIVDWCNFWDPWGNVLGLNQDLNPKNYQQSFSK